MGSFECCKPSETSDKDIVSHMNTISRQDKISTKKLSDENEKLKKSINKLMQQISQKEIIYYKYYKK